MYTRCLVLVAALWFSVVTVLYEQHSVSAVATHTAVTDAAATALVAVHVIPKHNAWFLIPPTDRQSLVHAATLSSKDIESLIETNSPDAIGIAIFALYQQGDLASLLSLRHLLSDDRASIPTGAFTSMRNQFGSVPCSVAEHLSTAYADWLGVPATTKTFGKYYRDVADPWSLPKPWIAKLAIATPTPGYEDAKPFDRADLLAVKQQVFALDEPLRWSILAEVGAVYPHILSRQELQRELGRISPDTRAAITARSVDLPYDPRFLDRTDEQLDRLIRMEQALRAAVP